MPLALAAERLRKFHREAVFHHLLGIRGSQ